MKQFIIMPFGLGKNVKQNTKPIKDTKNKFGLTHEEMVYYFKNIQEEITNQAKPRTNAVEVIHRLKKEGNKIYIISGRNNGEYKNPEKLTKQWLKNNSIPYDQLILTNAYQEHEKTKACIENQIDIMIDDSIHTCLDLNKNGIKVYIMDTRYNQKEKTLERVLTWEEIYHKITTKKKCEEKI